MGCFEFFPTLSAGTNLCPGQIPQNNDIHVMRYFFWLWVAIVKSSSHFFLFPFFFEFCILTVWIKKMVAKNKQTFFWLLQNKTPVILMAKVSMDLSHFQKCWYLAQSPSMGNFFWLSGQIESLWRPLQNGFFGGHGQPKMWLYLQEYCALWGAQQANGDGAWLLVLGGRSF